VSEEQKQPESESVEGEHAATEELNAESAGESVSESAVASSTDELSQRLESLQGELMTAKEDALRAQAEAQNARRRAEQDVEKAHKFGQDKIINDLLPVVDNLERALAATSGDEEVLKPIVEGVELTLKSFVDALKRHSVEVINPVGEPFDPQSHQAISAVENSEVEPNTVLEVFQKGYSLHGRLVRPAMVVVSKASS